MYYGVDHLAPATPLLRYVIIIFLILSHVNCYFLNLDYELYFMDSFSDLILIINLGMPIFIL